MRFMVEIPGQPVSANRQWRSTQGRVYKIPEAHTYEGVVATLVRSARPIGFDAGDYHPDLGQGFIVIDYALFLKHDMDCDNIEKPLLDGVKWGLGTEVVYRGKKGRQRPVVVPVYDDARFLPRAASKRTGVEDPHVILWIDDGA